MKEELAEYVIKRLRASDTGVRLLEHALGAGGARIGCQKAMVPLITALLYRELGGPVLVAVPGDAAGMASDVNCFAPDSAAHMPAPGPTGDLFRPYEEAVGGRLAAASRLEQGEIAVAGVEALLGGIPGPLPEPWPLELREGGELPLEWTLRVLVEGGYQREYAVEGWGRFAIRGGILDIFPSTADRPVRIELSGDNIESLREFSVVTQRSSSRLERVFVYPAREIVAQGGALPVGTRLIAVDPEIIKARAVEFQVEDGPGPAGGPLPGEAEPLIEINTMRRGDSGFEMPGEPVREFRGDIPAALREWDRLITGGTEVLALLDGRGQVERARELWLQGNHSGEPWMEVGGLRRGFHIPPLGLALFTTADLLGRRPESRRRKKKVTGGAPVSSYAELEIGGYAVHVDQGIGIFRGLTSREVLGVTREYILLEYAQGDRLYVPTTQLEKVQRYVGVENPTVHKLRGREWSRSRRAARKSAEKTARELLGLYLERKSAPGFAFSEDTMWQAELENAFPYEDTPDQARATREVKRDMESPEVMDRLICGDVGYGKTEVAVRAALKAVMDSRQTAVLVPTTVLARQHLETFAGRLAAFPVSVRMLSRFVSKKEQQDVVEGLRTGGVDVVIGTHRLLQDDVEFRDLGLLVVDEEQKFGVAHKERLRRMKKSVDTITMTATPIPRTLQMSLSGVRDVSIIDTPPEDRHPVATYVGEFDVDLVKHALGYEIARGGQSFYVHNRISTISTVADTLRDAFPGVSIAVAHGSMDEDDLERIMLEFADGMHEVLVCTTIIESGLDLPNVNTLVVDRAERLGLAQLYQIRGRVGRSEKKAYCYLFYPRREVLSETAIARLATISEMTPLGSGMRVAMRDLEIRGAGNLLGTEQSGQIEAVGFELYCQLLKEAVDVLKGEREPAAAPASIELPMDAYIPEEYISDEESRVEQYRKFIIAGRTGRIQELEAELEDRFGEPPEPVKRLAALEKMRLEFGAAGFESVTMRGDELHLRARAGKKDLPAAAAAKLAAGGNIEADNIYIDEGLRTIYLKLELGEVNKRQEVLIMWLGLIIDDILEAVDSAPEPPGIAG